MILSEEQIKEINAKCPYEQGVFKEPYGIPVHIKEPVVYLRWETGGYSGGSCWGGQATYWSNKGDAPRWVALDEVLKVLKPDISYLQYRELEGLVETNHDTQYEYYGNSTDYEVRFIPLSKLGEFLESI
jgi:hypothetical protein